MTRWQRLGRMAPVLAVLLLAVSIGTTAWVVLRSPTASAETEDLTALKTYWQDHYRDLRQQEARLIETVQLASKEYADANRRNYRRSGVRHFHRTNANEAKAELAKVRTQIESVYEEVVAAGGSVNWIYEVDDEGRDLVDTQGLGVYEDRGQFGGKGAYAPAGDARAREGDQGEAAVDGRNPLYDDAGDDVPASIEQKGHSEFDYDSWRKSRGNYEQDRAPERHLGPDDVDTDTDTDTADDGGGGDDD